MTAGHLLHNGSVTIDVGGISQTVNSKTELTPAEYLAVMEVASGGQQSVIIGTNGVATGGTIIINQHLSQQLASLVIPQGVTVIDISRSGTLNLSGNITDAGKLYLESSNPLLSAVTINASNITVQGQGLISDVLTPATLNLNLDAANNINNSGTILSSGSVGLTAGSGNIINAGSIIATKGNINIASSSANTINING